MKHERIITETPKISIWNRIDILTTLNGTKRELELKCELLQVNLSNELLIDKAK